MSRLTARPLAVRLMADECPLMIAPPWPVGLNVYGHGPHVGESACGGIVFGRYPRAQNAALEAPTR